jgi:hypothetical protein
MNLLIAFKQGTSLISLNAKLGSDLDMSMNLDKLVRVFFSHLIAAVIRLSGYFINFRLWNAESSDFSNYRGANLSTNGTKS